VCTCLVRSRALLQSSPELPRLFLSSGSTGPGWSGTRITVRQVAVTFCLCRLHSRLLYCPLLSLFFFCAAFGLLRAACRFCMPNSRTRSYAPAEQQAFYVRERYER
jgi:hypothetical protein